MEPTSSSNFTLIAHRGYPNRYPENTLLGFEQAIRAGALFIEADVLLSRDAVPFVFHDRSLVRLCGVDQLIYRLDSEQLLQCHPSDPQRFGVRFQNVPMLQLKQLVELLQHHPEVTLFVELKRGMQRVLPPAAAVARVIAELQPVCSQTVLISFSVKLLQQAQQQGWKRLAPVLTRWYQLQLGSIRRLQPEWLFIAHQRIPSHTQGLEAIAPLAVYEVSDYEHAMALFRQGVRWIETDSIGEMLQQQREVDCGQD